MRPDDPGALLAGQFPGAEVSVDGRQLTVDVDPADWLDALRQARDGAGCDFFDWLSAVDELDTEPPGIRVVAHVYNTEQHHRVLLRTLVSDPLRLPSATGVYRGADWHERETHEMFGVIFDDHPNLVPLLLPDGFVGTPLRKDFVLASRVVKQWPGAVDPGQSLGEASARRKPKRALGVPPPEEWGPEAASRSVTP